MTDSFVHLHTHTEFCLAPNTRVATADLHWVPISKVEIGDELVGFDEQLTDSKMKRTVVESKRELVMPSYRITMEDGSEIVASDLHLWVVIDGPGHIRLPDGAFRSNGNHSRKWRKTKDLIPGKHKIVKWASPWGELSPDQLYDAGYLAGILEPVGIVSVEFLGDVEVVGIQTSERTFVAEGFLTHNSMLDGHSKVDELVKAVARDGQPALAITDHGNMYGAVPFYNACRKAGVKPIIGCLLAGQPILTRDGVRNVEDIQEGDLVLTHRGRFRKVLSTMSRVHRGTLYDVAIGQSGKILTLTDEHPILVRSREGELQWLKPEEIKVGQYRLTGLSNHYSYLCFPKLEASQEDSFINAADYLPDWLGDVGGHIGKLRKRTSKYEESKSWPGILPKIEVDEDFARFLGLFIAEGSFGKRDGELNGAFSLCFNIDETAYVDFVKEFLSKRFNIDMNLCVRPDKSIIEIYGCCLPFAFLLKGLCGDGARNKKVPGEIISAKESVRLACVVGLLEGDGKKDKQQTFKVASKDLVWQMRMLISSLDIWSDVQHVGSNYSINVQMDRSYARCLADEDFTYKPIRSIVSRMGDVRVYNFEVEEDNSYVSDFVLHNCELYQALNHVSDRPKNKKRVADDSGDSGSEDGHKLYYHLIALAETNVGYQNLMKLSSEAFIREDAYYYKPRVDWDMLSEYSKGLITTSGCLGGQVLQALMRDDYTVARHVAGRFQDIFGRDNFFIEMQDHGIPEQIKTNPMLVRLARDLNAPLLLTNDSHYVHPEDAVSHDLLLCCQTKAKLKDKERFRFDGQGFYVKSAEEMRALFPDLREAADNTLWVAERCDVNIEMGVASLPAIETPEEHEDNYEWLMELCVEGCMERYGAPLPGEVRQRLLYEIDTVDNMGFLDYFLIVHDLVEYAKKRNIRVGPGRGSAAGSIIAYSLGITDIDPLQYGLLFERFLNPARVSMPDIDMDWDTRYRNEMVQYCIDKYGYDHVANIITYSTIKSRMAVRDTVRVLDFPYEAGNKLIDLMPPLISGFETPLEHCLTENPRYEQGYANAAKLRALLRSGDLKLTGQQVLPNSQVREIIDAAMGLEGLRRQDGVHAAAVVLSDKPLVEYLPVQRKPKQGEGAPLVTQYDMGVVEDLGLLKMDFLGLKNLDIISDTIELIKERSKSVPDIRFGKIDLKDPVTIQLLNRAETLGIFQIESVVMRDTIRAMNLDSFEDLAALNALCRPGPMADHMHFSYGARKQGIEPAETFHPDAEEILGDTYNLMIYQEQLMGVAQKFGGYSLGEAYLMLKACAKKKKDLMEAEQERFIQGCLGNGYSQGLADEIWSIIEPFSSYSFNKSHAVAYAFISYQTAYLKANYPVEFMSCLLSANMSDPSRLRSYLNECRRMGLNVLPPDVNNSRLGFYPVNGSDLDITFGFEGVKGIGHVQAAKVIAERDENGPYRDFFDFCERLLNMPLNKKMVKGLVNSGAFQESRLGLLEIMDDFLQAVRKKRKKSKDGQFYLDLGDNFLYPEVPSIKITVEKLLELEVENLGLYISSHPLNHINPVPVGTVDISDVVEYDHSADVTLVGVVNTVEVKTTRRGERMAIVDFQDLSGSAEIVVFPKLFKKISFLLIRGQILKIDASYEVSNTRNQFIGREIGEFA